LDVIQQQVEDDRQNCLKRRDDAPIIFARQLTAQGYFYLDKNDSRVLFEVGVLSKQSRRQQLLSRLCPWLLRLLSLWKAFFAALVICSSA
jgi:hypothetical protein